MGLMQGASHGFRVIRNGTDHRNHEDTKEVMTSLIKGCILFWCLNGVSKDGYQNHAQSMQLCDPKKSNPHILAHVGSGLVLASY